MEKRFYGLFFCILVLRGNAQVNNIPAPKNVKIDKDSVSDTTFWVTWEPVSKADSYKVVLSPPKIGARGVGTGITDRFTVIEGLSPDTEYKVTIVPIKGNDEGTPAVIVQRTALPAPIGFKAASDSITASDMIIGWIEVPGAQSYSVEIAPSTGVTGGGRGIYKGTTHLIGMTPNTEYTITVRAINWVGLGAAATIKQLTKLPPPTNVRVIQETISHNSMSIHWNPVVGAETYEVSVSPPDNVIGAGQGITDTYAILRGLKADTQYRVQVGAVNGAGLSDFREAISKTLSICYAKGIDFTKDVFTIACPARCARNQEHVYGTREYTDDSYICASAVHDGRIDDNVGGDVVVKKRPGLPHYVGTGKHGVLSKDYGSWHSSFVFGLQIPKNIRIVPSSILHNSFTVEWDEVSGADAYRISVQPGYGVVGDRAGIQETKATLSGLKADTEYQIYLTATNTLETSEAATIKQYTTLSAPKKLQVVRNSVMHDRMNISWFRVPGALHYIIEVQSESSIPFKQESKQISSVIDGLQSGVRYVIGVRAVNSIGLGAIETISQYTKLATPENVNAESVNWYRMYVQWDTVSGASHYLVSTVPPGLRNATEITEVSYIWLEDLFPNTKYEIRIQAENPHERSRSTTITQRTALGQPKNLAVIRKTHNDLTLTWDKVKNADTYYFTIESIDGKYGQNDETRNTRLEIEGLTGMTEYQIKIVPRNRIGDGKSVTIGVTTMIPPPSNLHIRYSSLDSSQIAATWTRVPEATGYYISISPVSDVKGMGLVTNNEATLGGIKIGITYTLKVMAVVGAERGMNATYIVSTGLPSPKNVSIDKDYISTDSLCVTWDAVVEADTYNITYQNSRTSEKLSIYDIQNGPKCILGLDPGTRYVINVFASRTLLEEGEEQLGSPGSSVVGVTKNVQPTGIKYLNMTDTSVRVFWNESQYATEYNVFIEPDNGVIGAGVRNVSEALFRGLTKGTDYFIWIYANNENDALSNHGELEITAGSQTSEVNNVEVTKTIETEKQPSPSPSPSPSPETPNNSNDKMKKEPNEVESNPQGTWIIIVVIVICLGLLILFTVVPCCCDCIRSKPLLKYHGWCGCCSPCSDVGCCGCRGCCNAYAGKQDEDHYDIAGGRPYTPNLGRRTPRTQSRQSYGNFH